MSEYTEITPIERSEAEAILRNGSTEEIPLILVRLAYFESDWVWVQDTCITFSSHGDLWIRRTCAICFGHLARIHGKIEMQKVMPVLDRMLQDNETMGDAQDTIEDFKVFLK